MIKLQRNRVRTWASFKVFYKKANSNKWMPLPTTGTSPTKMLNSHTEFPQIGMYVKKISQRCFPSFGEASIETIIGNVNGQNVGFKNNEITALDLKGREIYISASTDGGDERCVFWGVCDYQKDMFSPSATPNLVGKRVYTCVDLLYYHTYKSTLDFHGYAHDTLVCNRSAGMPWYNGRIGRSDIKQGNKLKASDPNKNESIAKRDGGVYDLQRFTFDGIGDLWNDKEVVEHVIHNAQRPGKLVQFTVNDVASDTLSRQKNTWQVREGETPWSVINRILKFSRGNGVSFFNYDQTAGVPSNPKITINPQHAANITVVRPSDTSEDVFQGATELNTTVTVDLTGDQRSNDGYFSLGGVDDWSYDRVEVTGEKIQVMCNIAYGDTSLMKLWSAEEQTAFDALNDDTVDPTKHDHIYRLFGLPRNWNGVTGNGNGTSGPSGGETDGIYFYCDDAGILQHGKGLSPQSSRINPALIRVLPDIPMHSGIDPTTGDRYAGDSVGVSMRGRLLVFNRTASESFELLQSGIRLKSDGIWLGSVNFEAKKDRPLGDYDASEMHEQLVMTLGLELPTRASVSRGADYDAANTVKRIRLQGAHLWLGGTGTIYAIDDADNISRFADTTYLKDDRDRIAYAANLAEQWYVATHQTCKWSLKDFGLGGSFEAEKINASTATFEDAEEFNGEDINYPKLGELVTTINAAGQDHILNAPITSVVYDNASGTTFWIADWGELEL